MGTLAWLVLVLAGVALGVAAGRFWPLDSLRLKTVENERDAASKELQSYRDEVSEHFQHTGELFDRITRDYHTLYEHLATGADRLCSPAHAKNLLQAEPERRKLVHEGGPGNAEPAAQDAAAAGTAAPTAASPAAVAQAKTGSAKAEAAGDAPAAAAATPAAEHAKDDRRPAPGPVPAATPAAAGAPSAQSAAPVAPAMAADAGVNGKADTSKADTSPRPRDNVAAIRPELRAVESAADNGSQQAPRKKAPPAA
jgi:uncharacterized membrane-anchored protein YhcB (DUF1043 family)